MTEKKYINFLDGIDKDWLKDNSHLPPDDISVILYNIGVKLTAAIDEKEVLNYSSLKNYAERYNVSIAFLVGVLFKTGQLNNDNINTIDMEFSVWLELYEIRFDLYLGNICLQKLKEKASTPYEILEIIAFPYLDAEKIFLLKKILQIKMSIPILFEFLNKLHKLIDGNNIESIEWISSYNQKILSKLENAIIEDKSDDKFKNICKLIEIHPNTALKNDYIAFISRFVNGEFSDGKEYLKQNESILLRYSNRYKDLPTVFERMPIKSSDYIAFISLVFNRDKSDNIVIDKDFKISSKSVVSFNYAPNINELISLKDSFLRKKMEFDLYEYADIIVILKSEYMFIINILTKILNSFGSNGYFGILFNFYKKLESAGLFSIRASQEIMDKLKRLQKKFLNKLEIQASSDINPFICRELLFSIAGNDEIKLKYILKMIESASSDHDKLKLFIYIRLNDTFLKSRSLNFDNLKSKLLSFSITSMRDIYFDTSSIFLKQELLNMILSRASQPVDYFFVFENSDDFPELKYSSIDLASSSGKVLSNLPGKLP